MKCDHADGTLVGTCAVCDEPVCSECYTALFSTVICANHEGLEDESDWELVAQYPVEGAALSIRYFLDDNALQSIVLENEDGRWELYVPIAEKDEAWASLDGEAGDEMVRCDDCRVYYAADLSECPVCGKEREES